MLQNAIVMTSIVSFLQLEAPEYLQYAKDLNLNKWNSHYLGEFDTQQTSRRRGALVNKSDAFVDCSWIVCNLAICGHYGVSSSTSLAVGCKIRFYKFPSMDHLFFGNWMVVVLKRSKKCTVSIQINQLVIDLMVIDLPVIRKTKESLYS